MYNQPTEQLQDLSGVLTRKKAQLRKEMSWQVYERMHDTHVKVNAEILRRENVGA